MDELVIARNPEEGSTLPFLVRLPLGRDGVVLKVRETWPRTARVYCHPAESWPADPDIVERVPVRSCTRRGAAIDRLPPEQAVALAQRILGRLDEPVSVNGRRVSIGASIGIAADDGRMSPEELLRRADAARYEAKHSRTRRYATAAGQDGREHAHVGSARTSPHRISAPR